jgi:myo-inositol-1-phosphate synthase
MLSQLTRSHTTRWDSTGDDLASQIGSSMVHRALLELLATRGVQVSGTYQLNIGGKADFRNLRENGSTKLLSELNVLEPVSSTATSISIIPSGGVVEHLADRKVAHISIEGRGRADTPLSIDVKLEVQDSSNAAGVIIDLVRLACWGVRAGIGGFREEARDLVKSPPTKAAPD